MHWRRDCEGPDSADLALCVRLGPSRRQEPYDQARKRDLIPGRTNIIKILHGGIHQDQVGDAVSVPRPVNVELIRRRQIGLGLNVAVELGGSGTRSGVTQGPSLTSRTPLDHRIRGTVYSTVSNADAGRE